MQLLESSVNRKFWVFEAWGRIGSPSIGSKQLQCYRDLHSALCRFHTVYTANRFENTFRRFRKQHNKYHRLDVEIQKQKKTKADNCHQASKLDAPVFNLMEMLFDINKVEQLLNSCELELKQMPLGEIRVKQMKMAMSALQEIEKLIQQKATARELCDASNKFYTLLPHAFGIDRPPIIDSIAMVSAKSEMLESMLTMETVYKLSGRKNEQKIHPLDACYRELKASITPVPKDSDKFRLFCDIVRNTQDATWNHLKLEVLEVFEVVRDAEVEQSDCHINWKLKNHQLLWHGSPIFNFANILSNGLMVTAPEAPKTGHSFGKGLYFADVISQSAMYCRSLMSHRNAARNNDVGIGLILLCEVALGISTKWEHQPFNPTATPIPNDEYQSMHVAGAYIPNQYCDIDGVRAPFTCERVSAVTNNALLASYNEFIVFDPNQVKIRYLFKMTCGEDRGNHERVD